MEQETLHLDKGTIKAISADTRIKIIKALDKQQQTLSDLAYLTNLSIPTIKEHLSILELSNLIKKEESERKWKYYTLTEKGRAILYPDTKRIWITLSLFILSVIGVAVSLFSSLVQNTASLAKTSFESTESAPIGDITARSVPEATRQTNILPYIFPLIALILLIILIYFILKYKQKLRRIPN